MVDQRWNLHNWKVTYTYSTNEMLYTFNVTTEYILEWHISKSWKEEWPPSYMEFQNLFQILKFHVGWRETPEESCHLQWSKHYYYNNKLINVARIAKCTILIHYLKNTNKINLILYWCLLRLSTRNRCQLLSWN